MPTVKVRASMLLLTFLQNYDCQSQSQSELALTVNRQLVTIPPYESETTQNLTVTCQSKVPGNNIFSSLAMSKYTHGPLAGRIDLVLTHQSSHGGKPYLINHDESWRVSGGLRESSISLSIPRVRCSDAGNYSCTAVCNSRTVSEDSVFMESANVSVQASPGHLSLEATPPNRTVWMVNETLNLTCSGPVGTIDGNDLKHWVLQFKISAECPWKTYRGPKSIFELQTNVHRECYSEQTVTFQRRLRYNDTGLHYRCANRWNNRVYDEYAATYYVGTVIPHDDRETDPPSLLTIFQTGASLYSNASTPGHILIAICRPPDSGAEALHGLVIVRVPPNDGHPTPIPLASADRKIDSGKARLEVTGDEWGVSGSTSTKSVTLTVTGPSRDHSGTYVCVAVFTNFTAGGPSYAISAEDVTVATVADEEPERKSKGTSAEADKGQQTVVIGLVVGGIFILAVAAIVIFFLAIQKWRVESTYKDSTAAGNARHGTPRVEDQSESENLTPEDSVESADDITADLGHKPDDETDDSSTSLVSDSGDSAGSATN